MEGAGSQPSSDDALIETARKLEISTEGKTREQISREIVEKFKAKEQNSAEPDLRSKRI